MIWFILAIACVVAAVIIGGISANVFMLTGGLFGVAAAIAVGFSWIKDCLKDKK